MVHSKEAGVARTATTRQRDGRRLRARRLHALVGHHERVVGTEVEGGQASWTRLGTGTRRSAH